MNIIEINNLSHHYADGTPGIENVNLAIPRGAFVVLAGRNGSGKTTLLRHLNGLLHPGTGEVRLDGVPVHRDLVRSRQMVGMVFQDADSQIVGETVYDDVAFGPENLCLGRAEIHRRVMAALESVGLSDRLNHPPYQLSGGEKRRLAIAGILAMNCRIIVLDEPFQSLDYPGVRQVLRHLVSLHLSGHTILLATHDLEKVIAHAEQLVIMEEGTVVRTGSPSDLLPEVETFGIRCPCAVRFGLESGSWLN